MKDLFTERLILNKINSNDVEGFYNICGDEKITTSFMMEHANNIEEARSMLDSLENKYEDENFIFWAIRQKENCELIGVLLSYESEILELGYAIARAYQNKGYATEALKAVTDYFLITENAKEIVLGCFIDNFPSIRVMEKCGYNYYCLKPNEFFYKGKTRDIIYYVKKEY